MLNGTLILALAVAAGPTGTLDDLAEKIEALRVRHEIPSIAVSIVRDGEIRFERGFGWARLEDRVPATPHTQYAIGSVSKAMTAVGLMRLVDAGAVDLDQPVNRYLGDTPLRSTVGDPDAITLRQVANHTAGLMKYVHFVNRNDPLGIPALADQIAQYGIATGPPGQRWIYSNLGWGVGARILELQSGLAYARYMKRNVFAPLGMTQTSVGPQPGREAEAARRYSGEPGREGTPIPDYAALPLATGHIYSTAHDLARFAIFNLKHHLDGAPGPLTEAAIDEMHRPTFYTARYIGKAVAWATAEDEEGRLVVVEHDGGGDGMRAELQLYPREAIALAILVNSDSPHFREIRRTILEHLEPEFAAELDALYAIPLEEEPVADPSADVPNAAEMARLWTEKAATLAGEWEAEIDGPLGSLTIQLTVRPSGDVLVGFDRQGIPGLLARGSRGPESISGIVLGLTDPEIAWRSAPHIAVLELEVGVGLLAGTTRFVSYLDLDEAPCSSEFDLSFRTEFRKRTEANAGSVPALPPVLQANSEEKSNLDVIGVAIDPEQCDVRSFQDPEIETPVDAQLGLPVHPRFDEQPGCGVILRPDGNSV